METSTPTPGSFVPCRIKRLTLSLLLAAITVMFGAGCESMRCLTCPDARNQAAPAPARA